jgi:predicted dehydrogenase
MKAFLYNIWRVINNRRNLAAPPGGTPPGSRVFHWAFIGAGWIARSVAQQILATGRHKIDTVYNRTFSKAQTFAEKYGARACETLIEAVTAQGVDGVYIATTAETHFDLAKACLEAGKPVLVEKPFTVSRKEAEALFSLAREKNLYLAEAMWTWFSPVSRQVKAWLDGGEVGKVQQVKIAYGMPGMGFFFPRLKDPNRTGGALLDIGVYPITYCYNLFGQPVKVECSGKLKNGVDVEEDVTLSYANGLETCIRVSMMNLRGQDLVISGDKGTIKNAFYHASGQATLLRKDGSKAAFEGNGGLDNEFNLAAEEILRGQVESKYVPPQATLANLAVMDECRRQMGLIYPFEVKGSG